LSAAKAAPFGTLGLSLVADTHHYDSLWSENPLTTLPEATLAGSAVARLPDDDIFAIPWLEPLLEEVL
jgi:hypothetical protein